MDRWVLSSVQHRVAAEVLPGDAHAGAHMGMVGATVLISYMAFAPVFGVLAERWSRWTLVGLGTVVGTLATGWTGLAGSLGVLLASRAVVGISEAAFAPAAPALLADAYGVARRGKVMTLFYAAIPVGSALGYVLGGMASSHWGWRWAFWALVPPGLVAGGCALSLRDSDGRGVAGGIAVERHGFRERVAIYQGLFAIPSYAYCVAGMTAMTFALGGISFWMPEYILAVRHHGTDASVNGTLGGIVAATGLTATLAGGWLADRLRGRWPGAYFLVSGVGLWVGLPLFLAVLYAPFPLAWVGVALAVFALFFNMGPTNAIIANVVAPRHRAIAFALSIFAIHAFGDVVSLYLIGYLKDRMGLQRAMLLVAGMFAVGGALWVMGARHLARDTARAEALAA